MRRPVVSQVGSPRSLDNDTQCRGTACRPLVGCAIDRHGQGKPYPYTTWVDPGDAISVVEKAAPMVH